MLLHNFLWRSNTLGSCLTESITLPMRGGGVLAYVCYTVPLKCKLTVSTRNSILNPQSFRESSIEFRGSSFKFRDTQRVFEDLKQRFWGNDLILKNKTIAMNKKIDARLYSGKPAVECMQIFFRVVHFLQDTRFAYLHWSWWQQTSLASKCISPLERLWFRRRTFHVPNLMHKLL